MVGSMSAGRGAMRIRMACAPGSSSVFSSALAARKLISCAASIRPMRMVWVAGVRYSPAPHSRTPSITMSRALSARRSTCRSWYAVSTNRRSTCRPSALVNLSGVRLFVGVAATHGRSPHGVGIVQELVGVGGLHRFRKTRAPDFLRQPDGEGAASRRQAVPQSDRSERRAPRAMSLARPEPRAAFPTKPQLITPPPRTPSRCH